MCLCGVCVCVSILVPQHSGGKRTTCRDQFSLSTISHFIWPNLVNKIFYMYVFIYVYAHMHVCWGMCTTVCMRWLRIIFGSLLLHHMNSRDGTHYIRCSKWLNCWAISLPPNQKKKKERDIYKNAYRNIKISLMEKPYTLNIGDNLLLIMADRINFNAEQLPELNMVWSKGAALWKSMHFAHTHMHMCKRIHLRTWFLSPCLSFPISHSLPHVSVCKYTTKHKEKQDRSTIRGIFQLIYHRIINQLI